MAIIKHPRSIPCCSAEGWGNFKCGLIWLGCRESVAHNCRNNLHLIPKTLCLQTEEHHLRVIPLIVLELAYFLRKFDKEFETLIEARHETE